jgi:DNA polymerase-3 subunit gamma/tau
MLTGIRGTGKTTTARIIARALNYKGPDGTSGPTTGPTDDCEICKAIAADRHPDVMEMDAASRTGVDDIREILDGVRYAPTSARYKVYIIDEVHMLSKAAFNALLKTLEEPPEHVIFIFATTEIRKVPVTVLSRCQRFDLRRVDVPTLSAYYRTICEQEKVECDPDALSLIARAADGSVRDGLSLLDQAISLSDGTITALQIQDMLGLADRGLVLDILEKSLTGDCPAALDILSDLYRKGAEPATLMQDLLDFTHLLTRFKAAPKSRETNAAYAEETLDRLVGLSAKLSMPSLGRAWQILLKGLAELQGAPNAHAASEMILIRLAYAANLPDPGDLIKRLKDSETQGGSSLSAPAAAPRESTPETAYAGTPLSSPHEMASAPPYAPRASTSGGGASAALSVPPQAEPSAPGGPVRMPETLAEIEALVRAGGHFMLAGEIYQYVHLIKLEPGRLEFFPDPRARQSLATDLRKILKDATGTQWMVSIATRGPGQPTLAEVKQKQEEDALSEVRAHPLVADILQLFPGAKVRISDNDKPTEAKS